MTPLARMVLEDIASPMNMRVGSDEVGVWSKMSDVHCFEMSKVFDVMNDLAWKLADGKAEIGELAFLPAPKTWIEFEDPMGPYAQRQAYLLIESDDKKTAMAYQILDSYDETENIDTYWTDFALYDGNELPFQEKHAQARLGLFHDGNTAGSKIVGRHVDPAKEFPVRHEAGMIYAALALINTPRIIGRQQHSPNRHLQRRLLRAFKAQGSFPLQAWTEIKLEISPPHDASGEPPSDAHLTGQRALHFCRAHLRIRYGKLEVIRSHWRGDASLGIKRSRYSLVQ